MIGAFPLPRLMPRMGLRSLAFAGIAGPTFLTADAAAANPALTGAVILSALLMFGTFVLARWKMLLLTAPIWIVLMAQMPGEKTAEAAPPTAQAEQMRPSARPWG